jgi:hypothetical protein
VVLESLKMLYKTVIRSLCEGPVKDVKLILAFSNQWVSIQNASCSPGSGFLFDNDFYKVDHTGQSVQGKSCLSQRTGRIGSITADACT